MKEQTIPIDIYILEVDMSSLHNKNHGRRHELIYYIVYTKYILLKWRRVRRRLSSNKQELLTKRFSGGVHAAQLFSFYCVGRFLQSVSSVQFYLWIVHSDCLFGLLERLFKDHRLIITVSGSVHISK